MDTYFIQILTSLDISTGQFAKVVEMNSDEFTLFGKDISLVFSNGKLNQVHNLS